MEAGVGLSNRIRTYVLEKVVGPALRAGQTGIRVRAGDIHRDLGLENRMPAVCSALESHKFQSMSGLTLAGREGPHRGANAVFLFEKGTTGDAQLRRSPQPSEPKGPRPQAMRQSTPKAGSEVWISCVAQKRSKRCAAKDLYLSDWFQKARAYAESTRLPWQILSAKHGLVSPEKVISPYDLTLNNLPVNARRAWANQVVGQIQVRDRVPPHIILLAGARYREFLIPQLEALGISVEVPMSGLRIGEQLSWLNNAVSNG